MRIELTLENPGRQTAIPINYHYYLAGAIYRTLDTSSHDYAERLHNDGYEFQGKRFKLFTFSQLQVDDRRIDGDQLIVASPSLRWMVSSPVEEFVTHFANGILERGDLRIDGHGT